MICLPLECDILAHKKTGAHRYIIPNAFLFALIGMHFTYPHKRNKLIIRLRSINARLRYYAASAKLNPHK